MLDWICLGAWALWNDRNAIVHGRPIPNEIDRCEWIHRYISEFQQEKLIHQPVELQDIRYRRPSQSLRTMIINVDAAYDLPHGMCGFGAIIRTIHGSTIAAMHGKCPILSDPICAEAKAVLEGIRLAHRLEILEVDIYSDSLGLIAMLNGTTDEYMEAHAILWDIKLMCKSFSSI